MKKTLTVNIGGSVFHIEEDAYEALRRYLDDIAARLANSTSRSEIIADVEARIAEIFSERIAGRGVVVTIADVEHVVAIMGQPEDYAEGMDDAEGAATASQATGRPRHRRLFRDPDDRWVGGVLAGLAAYTGMDPIWFRLLFILLVVLGLGSPILIYILLWILVPQANTASERLMMHGDPVTVDNIKRSFEQGGERVARDVEDLGKRWSKTAEAKAPAFRSGARRAANITGTVIGKLVGMVLVVIGASFGVALLGGIVGGGAFTIDSMGHTHDLMEITGLVFASSTQALWFIIAAFLLVLVPIIGILTAGLQLMLGLSAPRWLGWSLGPLWIVALLLVIFVGIRLGSDFKNRALLRTEVELASPVGRVLHLQVNEGDDPFGNWAFNLKKGRMKWSTDGLVLSDDSVNGGWATLDIRRSPDDRPHLIVERRTHARTVKSSLARSGRISYSAETADSLLVLSPWLSWPKEDKLRLQQVRFVLQLPEGMAVQIHKDIGFMLDDVQNVTNTLDRDMAGKQWTMTKKGLDASATPYLPAKEQPEDNDSLDDAKEQAGPRSRRVEASHQAEVHGGMPLAVPGFLMLVSRVLRLGRSA